MIFICLTMVDLPDSPEPVVSARRIRGHRPRANSPSSKILHSFLNFLESSSNCLSIALLLSLLPRCSGTSASAALSPCAALMLPPLCPLTPVGVPASTAAGDCPPDAGTAGCDGRAPFVVVGAALEGVVGFADAFVSAEWEGRFVSSVDGVDMHPPMMPRVGVGVRVREGEGVWVRRGA